VAKNKDSGNIGEKEIVDLISCPNCGEKLMRLPPNYPLFDLQCTGCSFRAQVKTSNSKPKDEIFGAGWEVIDKVIKSGFTIPSLIVNFRWKIKGRSCQEILFYPFIPRSSLKKRKLSSRARRANYKMFNYTGLKNLPHFILYSRGLQ